MSLTTAALNEAANAVAIDTIKLHSGDPGDGTQNALAGATSPITLAAAVNGVRSMAAALDINVPAGTVSHYSLWQGATLKSKKAFPTPETYNSTGVARVTTATFTVANAP